MFRKFIKAKVRSFSVPVRLRYTAPAATKRNPDREEVFLSGAAEQDNVVAQDLTLRILSPVFFTRMIQDPSVLEAINSEGVNALEESRLIEIDNSDILKCVLNAQSASDVAGRTQMVPQIVMLLRRLHHQLNNRSPTSRPSQLDVFAIAQCSREEGDQYFQAVRGILLTQLLDSITYLIVTMFLLASGAITTRGSLLGHSLTVSNEIDCVLITIASLTGCIFAARIEFPAF